MVRQLYTKIWEKNMRTWGVTIIQTLFFYIFPVDFPLNWLNPDNIGRVVALHPQQVQESKHPLFCAELFATNMAGKSLFQFSLFSLFFTFSTHPFFRGISMKSLLIVLQRGNIQTTAIQSFCLDHPVQSGFKNILGKPQKCGILPIQQLSTRLCHDSQSGISCYFFKIFKWLFLCMALGVKITLKLKWNNDHCQGGTSCNLTGFNPGTAMEHTLG